MRRRWQRRSLKRWLTRLLIDIAILAALGATLVFVVVVMLGWR